MNPNRKPIIAGNWKMYKTSAEAMALVKELKTELPDVTNVEVVICPPFTALASASVTLKGIPTERMTAEERLLIPPSLSRPSSIVLGAQNVHWEKEGAFTGEIAASMLKEFSVRYAIVGHSERRQYFGETNEGVNKRAKAALASGIRPIVCVGETLVQRESNQTEAVVREHVTGGLAGFTKDDMLATVIAYEPVWAIGTGRVATPAQAQEVHAFIRGLLTEKFDASVAGKVRIQYGGSVKAANAKELLGQPDIDGALVGGASLDAKGFAQIVKSV